MKGALDLAGVVNDTPVTNTPGELELAALSLAGMATDRDDAEELLLMLGFMVPVRQDTSTKPGHEHSRYAYRRDSSCDGCREAQNAYNRAWEAKQPPRSREYVPRPKRTHCKQGHEYTEENTRLKSDGSRTCRTCQRAYQARNRAQRVS